jgi:hypothetical protein
VPCYRCDTRQVDPEPGKPSLWHRGVVREHQVLICPDCYPVALSDLTRCSRCDSVRLVRQLDQVECLDCRQARTALANGVDAEPMVPPARGADTGLAAEVARALERILGTP